MGCTWAVPGMKASACLARAGCSRLHRCLWIMHLGCHGALDFGGENVSRWSCLLMFPSDLQCRRMLRCCVNAAGIYGLWEGSPSHPCFTVLHGGRREHGAKAVPPCPTSQESRLFASAVKAGRVAKSRTFPVGTPEMDAAAGCPRDAPQGRLWHQPSTGTTVKSKQLCGVPGASSR